MHGFELLSPAEMALADRIAIEGGIAGEALMEEAGRAVADEARRLTAPGARIVVLCGPGNNGGDGFVAARHLARLGARVTVALAGERRALKGDAALMAGRWPGPIAAFTPAVLDGADLAIDAIFGAGLARPLEGAVAEMVAALARMKVPVLAVDMPSGLNGATGGVLGGAPEAVSTVTFFRLKPGHVLYPGRGLCGRIVLADIGIPARVLSPAGDRPAGSTALSVSTWLNDPEVWSAALGCPGPADHKYRRGHAVVLSGPAGRTGAGRLAARAALRAGAGLVTLASPPDALAENAASLTAVMLAEVADGAGLAARLADQRVTAVLAGPGGGVDQRMRGLVAAALASTATAVLDADALTSFEGDPETLWRAIAAGRRTPVMTPHEGELRRLFPDLAADRLVRARAAAARSGAVVVLKGADSVIAAPDGRAIINANAPPTLATAGSGDVLAGIVAGLAAQSAPAFEAAAAAVWLHGAAAARLGRGLIAEDLGEALPGVLANMAAARSRSDAPWTFRVCSAIASR
ncbi:MAG: NAD(P)H-hydrate dehydratase [Hyphomicrobiaceae bacterium]